MPAYGHTQIYVIDTLGIPRVRSSYTDIRRCTLLYAEAKYFFVDIMKMEAALLQQFDLINLSIHYIKQNRRQRQRKNRRMVWEHFCRHPDTQSLYWKLRYWDSPRWKGGSTHTLVIGSHTLCIRYSHTRIRYAYVTHTLAYVMHALLKRLHTLRIRW